MSGPNRHGSVTGGRHHRRATAVCPHSASQGATHTNAPHTGCCTPCVGVPSMGILKHSDCVPFYVMIHVQNATRKVQPHLAQCQPHCCFIAWRLTLMLGHVLPQPNAPRLQYRRRKGEQGYAFCRSNCNYAVFFTTARSCVLLHLCSNFSAIFLFLSGCFYTGKQWAGGC